MATIPATVLDRIVDPERLSALAGIGILDTPPEGDFDDIVRLAARLCGTPVALVSLVDHDRQWFKARVGFPVGETDLNSSVCAHALAEPDLLIVGDLTADPRTADNPLVTGDPSIRFYAGAPLRTAEGLALGSLCVVDTKSRPEGLTAVQADDLRALARQVMRQLELRRALVDKKRALESRDAVIATQHQVARAGGDLDGILGAIVAGAMKAIPQAEGGVVELLEGGSLVYRNPMGTIAQHAGLRRPLQGSLAGACFLGGEPILCPDVLLDDRVARDIVRPLRLRSCILVPVRRRGEVVGVLKLQSSRPAAFTDADIKIAQIIAASAALVLAELGLRQQSELLQSVTDQAGQAIFQLDDAGRVIFANPAAERMFGWSAPEMRGRNLHDLIHHGRPDGSPLPPEERRLRQALVSGRLLADADEVFLHRDGRPIHARVTNAPVLVDGVVDGIVLTVTDVTAHREAQSRLAESESYWRGLFARLDEGLVIGEVIRDPAGHVVDWRFVEVNAAWAKLVGVGTKGVIGHRVGDVLSGIEAEWIDGPADVVETGEPITFTRQVGQSGHWYEARISAIDADKFIALFLDVTERVRLEQALAASTKRKGALAVLGDHLRSSLDVGAIGYTAGAIVGQTLDAARAAYAFVDIATETVVIESNWSAPGVHGIAGRYNFRDYGSYINDLRAGKAVLVADVRLDPRTRDHASAFEALGIAALVNVPIVEHDVLVAVFLVHFVAPHALSDEDEAFIRAAADRTRAGIARLRAEDRQGVLNNEISHRLKNTLAMVQAIARQTLKGVPDRNLVAAFDNRLMALSTAHDALLRTEWEGADLEEMLRRVLDAAGAMGRYRAEGSAVKLGSRAALSTSLLLHELATNASKYGALTQPDGTIDVHWRFDGEAPGDELVLDWREVGGPPAAEPTRRGFGSRLLRLGLAGGGGSTIAYRTSGLVATFRAPRAHVERA